MTENTLAATDPEALNTESEATEPGVVDQDATDGAVTPAEPVKTPEQLEIERLRRALTKRDRTQGKLHQEREHLSQELERLRQAQPVQHADEAVQKQPADLRQAVEREAMTLAERIAERREFDAKCNSVATSGKKEFSDFGDTLNALIEEAGPLVSPNGSPTPLGEQILESDAPAALIHYLGKNPELAAELDGLTTARLARKLAAIEAQMTAKPKTSSAPKPLDPLKGAGATGNDLSDDLSMDEWLKRRNKQLAKR